jgi:hypothetical protein
LARSECRLLASSTLRTGKLDVIGFNATDVRSKVSLVIVKVGEQLAGGEIDVIRTLRMGKGQQRQQKRERGTLCNSTTTEHVIGH